MSINSPYHTPHPMPHLVPDRLAALADGDPTPAEVAHLAGCATCAAERDAHARVLTVAHLERERSLPPLTSWESLAPALRAEGLLRDVQATADRNHWHGWMRFAAALVLLAGGAMIGRVSVGGGVLPGVQAGSGVRDAMMGTFVPASFNSALPERPFKGTEEAIAALTASQQTYQRAVAYLAQQGPGGITGGAQPEAYQRRIAALDDIAGAVRAALWKAPDDPVVNQAYLQAMGARASALRQLGTTMPAGTRLASY